VKEIIHEAEVLLYETFVLLVETLRDCCHDPRTGIFPLWVMENGFFFFFLFPLNPNSYPWCMLAYVDRVLLK
jgi:hypothetical protein